MSCRFRLRIIASALLLLMAVWSASADTYVKREVRGVWMATVYQIDWPTAAGQTFTMRSSG